MVKYEVKKPLPKKHNAEDKIFNLCAVSSVKFAQFITNFTDITETYHERFLSDDFKDLILDYVILRENGELANIEHHTVVNENIMRRNFQLIATLHRASKRLVHPFLFNTGDMPKNTIEFASPTSFYNPVFVNTQEIEESVRLNNIKYKIEHNEKINIFDVYDLIWMPKYRREREIEDIVVELTEIYNQILFDEDLHSLLRKSLMLWAGKFVSDKEKIKKGEIGIEYVNTGNGNIGPRHN